MNNQNNNNNKKSILLPVIIVIVLAAVVVFGVSKLMKKDTSSDNIDDNNQQVQDNNKQPDDNKQPNNSGNGTSVIIPNNNTYDKDGAFLMAIDDVFTITGRGTSVTGRIERGTIKLNDEVQIIGLNHEVITTTVKGIEMFNKAYSQAEVGDSVGLLLKNVSREDVERGQVVAKTNSIKPIKKFEANVYMLTKEQKGRSTPIFNNHEALFYIRVASIIGTITLPDDVEKVSPGETSAMTAELTSDVAMEIGTTFTIREGGKTIGYGNVTKVY